MVSRELLAELKAILEEEHGKPFSSDEVADIGQRLTDFFGLLSEYDRRDNVMPAVKDSGRLAADAPPDKKSSVKPNQRPRQKQIEPVMGKRSGPETE